MIQSSSLTAVAAANHVKVDQFSQLWLVQNGIISEETSGGFFTPVAVNCSADEFGLFIIPNRIQVQGRGELERGAIVAADVLKRLLEQAADAVGRLSGIGFNVTCVLSGEKDSPSYLSAIRNVFFKDNALFDSYATEPLTGFTTTEHGEHFLLNTALNVAADAETGRQIVLLNMNFHRDCQDLDGARSFIKNASDIARVASERAQLIDRLLTEGANT